MAGRVTLQDIADALGLSRNTVSKAINNTGVLAEATRERVLHKAKEMGYKQFSYLQFGEDSRASMDLSAHLAAQGAASRREIAILSAGFIGESHFGSKMIDRFQHDISTLGFSISMYRIMPEEISSLRLPSALNPDTVAGIMCIELFDAAYCRMLCSLDKPLLLVDGPVTVFEGPIHADQLLMDNQSQLFLFLDKMKKHGKTKISYIGDIHHCQSFYERYSALRQYADLFGLRDEWSITRLDVALSDRQYRVCLESSLRALPSLPEVFLCANDFVALDVMDILKKMNISVPQDLLLCGFDDAPESRIVTPHLTSIHIDSQLMGESAARLLYSRIREPQMNCRTFYTETNLICRQSTEG